MQRVFASGLGELSSFTGNKALGRAEEPQWQQDGRAVTGRDF